jgi:cytochrome c oxidase subunit 4
MTDQTHHGDSGHAGVGHVVPLRVLIGTLAALLVLTVVTVAVTYVDLGPLNLAMALFIAVVKGALVLLFFMHLLWDRPFHAIVLIFSVALLMLFIGLALLDSVQYQPTVIPGYAPEIQR